MKRRPLLVAVAAAALVSACTTVRYAQAPMLSVNRANFDQTVQIPTVGVATTVEVGETLVDTSIVTILPTLELSAGYRLITGYREGMRMALDLPPGTYNLAATNNGDRNRFYSAPGGLSISYESKGVFADTERVQGGLYIDSTGGKFIYWFWPGDPPANITPAPDVSYRESTGKADRRAANFRRELVYTGSAQSTLTLLYREFYKDMARPSFSQELKYDLGKDRVVGYKGARIEILDTTNTAIRYRVLTPLSNDNAR